MQVFFFTEGGVNLGWGHLTRCLALAQEFTDRSISCKFIVRADRSVEDLLAGYAVQFYDWTEDVRPLHSQMEAVDIAVIDSYHAGTQIYQEIQLLIRTCVYFDDYNRLPYPPGLVINGALLAERIPYPAGGQITYLLGPDFLTLRRPFRDAGTIKRRGEAGTLLLTCGGSDPHQVTPVLSEFLAAQYPGRKIIALVGKSFQNPEKMRQIVHNNLQVLYAPSLEEIINSMRESDLAVTAAGQTIYELACSGVPAVVIGTVENQRHNIESWLATDFIEFAGWWNDQELLNSIKRSVDKLIGDPALRQARSGLGRKLIDGRGSRRITEKVLSYVRKNQVHHP